MSYSILHSRFHAHIYLEEVWPLVIIYHQVSRMNMCVYGEYTKA